MGLQVTASKVALLFECARPFDPEVEISPDEPGEAARYGSALHECLQIFASGRTPNFEDIAKKWGVECV